MCSGMMAAALITTNGRWRAPTGVNGARGEFLAAAGRADDEDAAVGRPHLFDVWRN